MRDVQDVQIELNRFLEAHPAPGRGCWQVRNLLICIHQHVFDGGVTVNAIKQLAALRDHNVSCLFKHEMGVSIKDYMDGLRLDAASELIATTSLSVATVAQSVGYQHLQTFYRAVRRRFGCTPVELRTCSSAMSSPAALPVETANPRVTPERDEPLVSNDERRILDAAMARILPSTEAGDGEGPVGAAEAGTIQYFDWMSRQDAFQPYTQTLRSGLALLDSLAVALYGKGFADCDLAAQDGVLRQVQEIAHPGAQRFFSLLMRMTLSGFLCAPMYGGNRNRLGWLLIDYTPDLTPVTDGLCG